LIPIKKNRRGRKQAGAYCDALLPGGCQADFCLQTCLLCSFCGRPMP